MSDGEDSNSNRNNNQANMSEEVIRRFERLFGDMRERLDRLNAMVTDLHKRQCVEVPNVRRWDRQEPRAKVHDV